MSRASYSSPSISETTLRKLKELVADAAERLYEAGMNVLPLFSNKKPAFIKGETYQMYLVKRMDREFFEGVTLARIRSMDRPWRNVTGIAVVCGMSGVVAVDYDWAKLGLPEIEQRIERLVNDFGSFVYIERRVGIDGSRYGLHAIVRVPNAMTTDFRVRPLLNLSGEFNVRNYGLINVCPTVLTVDGIISKYRRLSFVRLEHTYYDEDLSVLKRVVEILGGELNLKDFRRIETNGEVRIGGEPGKPRLGLKIGSAIRDGRLALRALKAIGEALGCEGFVAVIEGIEHGEWIVPYRILSAEYGDSLWRHPRSTWTIVENHIFRTLAEIGVSREVGKEVLDIVRELERRILESSVTVERSMKNLEKNFATAYLFKEHGHDARGACIYKLLGMCTRVDCQDTFLIKVFSNPDVVRRAVLRVIEDARRGAGSW